MSRINTNVTAIQAISRLISNQDDLARRLERLSSGLRINRGADDPAGLIASESLRSEIRGITSAIDNSTRAINVISTADAALSEVSKLLLEIKELVNTSSNSGALSNDEVQANQLQIDSLLESINRVANSTQFNSKKLLNGALSYTVSSQNTAHLPRLQVFGARIPSNSTLPVTIQVTQSAQTATLLIQAGGNRGLSASGFSSALSAANNVSIEIRGLLGTEVFSFTGGTTVSSAPSPPPSPTSRPSPASPRPSPRPPAAAPPASASTALATVARSSSRFAPSAAHSPSIPAIRATPSTSAETPASWSTVNRPRSTASSPASAAAAWTSLPI